MKIQKPTSSLFTQYNMPWRTRIKIRLGIWRITLQKLVSRHKSVFYMTPAVVMASMLILAIYSPTLTSNPVAEHTPNTLITSDTEFAAVADEALTKERAIAPAPAFLAQSNPEQTSTDTLTTYNRHKNAMAKLQAYSARSQVTQLKAREVRKQKRLSNNPESTSQLALLR